MVSFYFQFPFKPYLFSPFCFFQTNSLLSEQKSHHIRKFDIGILVATFWRTIENFFFSDRTNQTWPKVEHYTTRQNIRNVKNLLKETYNLFEKAFVFLPFSFSFLFFLSLFSSFPHSFTFLLLRYTNIRGVFEHKQDKCYNFFKKLTLWKKIF